MNIFESVFKAYDIRGLVESELSEDFARDLGRAWVYFLREKGYNVVEKKIVVAYDMRPSSRGYVEALVAGIRECGGNVVNIGMTSTPVFNFTCAHFEEHIGGIIVTASHNPASWNGFKLALHDGTPVGLDNGGNRIKQMMQEASFEVSEVLGSEESFDALEAYRTHLFALVETKNLKLLKVVVDYGNGMGGVVLPHILESLNVEVVSLYETPDGNFPNHEANPLKVETLVDLQQKVVAVGADFGFALDGDADRVGLVDETGAVVEASFVGALLGSEVLRLHQEGVMLYDLRSSMKVPEVWEALGGTPIMSRVGRAFLVQEMKAQNAIFGSELSLHLFYHDMHDLESSDLSFLYVWQMLSREGKPLSTLVEQLKTYFHSGEINFEVEDTDVVLSRVESAYQDSALEVSHLDGVRLTFDWGWISLRKSNTEPVVRLNLEANTKETMESMVGELQKLIV